MTRFLINGVERPSPVETDTTLGSLLAYVEKELITEQSLLSAIKVDGKVLSQSDERALAGQPLSELETVELTFIHPRELAEETLQTLKPFAKQLAELSQTLGERLWSGEDVELDFQGLLDGLETFVESINTSKSILRIHAGNTPATVRVLEADLVTLLKDLIIAFESQKLEDRVALLLEPIPSNLLEWSASGIDLVIRSRDS